MVRTILFLTPIFHTLTLGKDFTKFCRDFEFPEGTTMLYANCDNFQKAETAAEIDLHNCLPCIEGPTRVACPWGVCKWIGGGAFLAECFDGQSSKSYVLGELLLFGGHVQNAHILYQQIDQYITNRNGQLICDVPLQAASTPPSSTPPSSTPPSSTPPSSTPPSSTPPSSTPPSSTPPSSASSSSTPPSSASSSSTPPSSTSSSSASISTPCTPGEYRCLKNQIANYYTGRPVPAGPSGGHHQKTSILPGGGVEGVPRQNRPAGASPNPRPLSRPADAAAEPRWAVRPARRRITPLIHRPTDAPPNHHLRHTVRPTHRPITVFDTSSDRRTAQSPSSRRRPTDALPKNHYRQ
jgi:hypothetical protein